MGGKVNNNHLYLNAWCGLSEPDEAITTFKKKIKEGFTHSAKIKVGTDNEKDYNLIKKVRDILPQEMDLIVDVNQAWSLLDARNILRRLNTERNIIIEQPLHWQDLFGMRKLNKEFHFDIMADESLMSLQDAFNILKLEAASMFNIKLLKCGGIFIAKKLPL